MQKRILIIGNNDGLPGVKVDIENYKIFFKSQYGGNWHDNEIIEKLNISKLELITLLKSLKNLSLNYLIVIFSGHGGQERETILELNSHGEYISESELKNLAYRQLNIFDCCRCYSQPILESKTTELRLKNLFSTREKYEKRIMEAVHQQASLYACSIGESANDTAKGGAYSKNLIAAAISETNEYTLVGHAHQVASILTSIEFKNQHPEAILPKCLSSQQLILGIRF